VRGALESHDKFVSPMTVKHRHFKGFWAFLGFKTAYPHESAHSAEIKQFKPATRQFWPGE
jgi:hypothetical protein